MCILRTLSGVAISLSVLSVLMTISGCATPTQQTRLVTKPHTCLTTELTVEGRIEDAYPIDRTRLIIRFEDGRMLKLKYFHTFGDIIDIPLRTNVAVVYDGDGAFIKVTRLADKWPTKIKLNEGKGNE